MFCWHCLYRTAQDGIHAYMRVLAFIATMLWLSLRARVIVGAITRR
jgi:hypothetical protein